MSDLAPGTRITRSFNRDWLFCYDPASQVDESRAQTSHSESDFYAVAVPHTWHTYETTGQVHPFTRDPSECDNSYWWYGWGWYRKHWKIDSRHQHKRVFLEFNGVQKYSRVYCNGVCVGEHKGGYASFSVEVTDQVRWDEENIVAVAVSSRRDDEFGNIPPMMAGNFNVYGGIYRGVRLVITNPVYIPFQGSAQHEGGVFVTTPEVNRERAKLQVVAHVHNASTAERTVQVTHRVLDAEDNAVATMEAPLTMAAGEQSSTQQSSLIETPRLWSTTEPYLYRVQTIVSDESGVLDTHEAPLGFRWFHWDYETDTLYLNDEPIHIHGTNRHQEYPWLGDALPQWMHERDLDDIHHNLGHNFIRFCHYTQDKFVYDYCDGHGILVCEEVPCIKNLPFGHEVQQQQVVEMIRRDRNHPCIVMWSMGNETNNAADGEWALAEDDTRIIHYRHVQGLEPEGKHTHRNLDMENLLRCTVRGWPSRDAMNDKEAQLPQDHEHGQVTGTEDWQCKTACIDGMSLRGRIDENTVVWIYADHGADREYRDCPLKHVNPKGWVDAYRQPKYMYYLWQAHYAKHLMAFVLPHWWQHKYLGQRRDITVYSNGEEVELFSGDKIIGKATPASENFFTVVFPDVEISNATLRVVARRGAVTTDSSLPMTGAPAALKLMPSHSETIADRAGIVLFTAEVLDTDGNAVLNAHPKLHWEIEGPGELLAPPVFTSDINQREVYEGTFYTTTPIVMPVRSTRLPGTIRVTVSAAGLKSARAYVESLPLPVSPDDGIIEFDAGDGNRQHRAAQQQAGKTCTAGTLSPIRIVHADFNFQGCDAEEIRRQLHKAIGEATIHNHSTTARQLIDDMVRVVLDNDGILIADDYNFLVAQFNRQLTTPAAENSETLSNK